MAKNAYNPHGKYYLPQARQSELYYRCLQLPEWQRELKDMDGLKGVSYDRVSRGSGTGDPTAETAIRRVMLENRIRMITETAEEVDPFLAKWIIEAVTTERPIYSILLLDDVPASRNQFLARRKKFYWLLSKKLEEQEQRYS